MVTGRLIFIKLLRLLFSKLACKWLFSTQKLKCTIKIMFTYVGKWWSNTEFALFKDTHREKVPLNETPAFAKSTNMSS